MAHHGSIPNQATSVDDSPAATAWLPRDVLAGVLLRLPASDLRRFRLVCKEWHELISDPAFVDDYMDHGSQALTHTIVFFPGSSPAYRDRYFFNNFRDRSTKEPHNGEGRLLNEHWQVTARFTVSESEDLVGGCNGLLCFLDVLHDAINIVEPFTGEPTTLPLPPKTKEWHRHSSYCFGFDPSSRRYKLLHVSRSRDSEQGLVYKYTIGEDTNWRRVHVVGAAPGDTYGPPMIINGAVYWSVIGESWLTHLARFDLTTEEVTLELIEFRQPSDLAPFSPVLCVLGALNAKVCLMTSVQHNELYIGEGARWANSRNVRLPSRRCLTWPQPLQRGHLLLGDYGNGGLYAHPIAPASDDLGSGNLMLETATSWQDAREGGTNRTPVTPTAQGRKGLFVPVAAAQGRLVPKTGRDTKTFGYAPPLSPAPLARYFGKLGGLH